MKEVLTTATLSLLSPHDRKALLVAEEAITDQVLAADLAGWGMDSSDMRSVRSNNDIRNNDISVHSNLSALAGDAGGEDGDEQGDGSAGAGADAGALIVAAPSSSSRNDGRNDGRIDGGSNRADVDIYRNRNKDREKIELAASMLELVFAKARDDVAVLRADREKRAVRRGRWVVV